VRFSLFNFPQIHRLTTEGSAGGWQVPQTHGPLRRFHQLYPPHPGQGCVGGGGSRLGSHAAGDGRGSSTALTDPENCCSEMAMLERPAGTPFPSGASDNAGPAWAPMSGCVSVV
jgi:hypothetical protein